MKILASLGGLLFAILAAYVGILIDSRDVRDFVAGEVCVDIASSFTTRPSTLEVNQLEVYQGELTLSDAIVWRTSDGDMTPAQRAVLEMNYEQNRPYLDTTITLDYSAEGRLGSVRDLLICEFVFDNRNFTLRSALQGNTIIYRTQDNAFDVMALSRLDLFWNVTDIGLLDRVRYAMTFDWFSR